MQKLKEEGYTTELPRTLVGWKLDKKSALVLSKFWSWLAVKKLAGEEGSYQRKKVAKNWPGLSWRRKAEGVRSRLGERRRKKLGERKENKEREREKERKGKK